MNEASRVRSGVRAAAMAAVVALTATACQGGEGGGAAGDTAVRASASASGDTAPSGAAAQALQAAWQKTGKAYSAKVRMTITLGGDSGGGTVEMAGVQGWGDVPAMDVTMRFTGAMKPKSTSVRIPESQRMILLGTKRYADVGPELAERTGGKRWMRMHAPASAAPGPDGTPTGMSNDPAEQLGVLLHSPNLKHLGTEQVDGTATEHYKGLVTLEEMAAVSPRAAAMPAEQRQRVIAASRAVGITGYDMDVWLGGHGYPVRMKVIMDSPAGTFTIDGHYSDFGAPLTISEPDAEDVFDPASGDRPVMPD
ncbi:hypothetical protein [Streptomyces sp. NPDC048603]|uniref:hypothetical protein n=1 Tax=Streptomyces sp. NPDC048603 TaxID=3365577 RepID=UPI003710D063